MIDPIEAETSRGTMEGATSGLVEARWRRRLFDCILESLGTLLLGIVKRSMSFLYVLVYIRVSTSFFISVVSEKNEK
jgi:hypothetical protein